MATRDPWDYLENGGGSSEASDEEALSIPQSLEGSLDRSIHTK
jgi:hypothetical protein